MNRATTLDKVVYETRTECLTLHVLFLYFHTFNIDNTVLRHVNQSGACSVVFTAMMLLMIANLANTCELFPCKSPYWFILRPTVNRTTLYGEENTLSDRSFFLNLRQSVL